MVLEKDMNTDRNYHLLDIYTDLLGVPNATSRRINRNMQNNFVYKGTLQTSKLSNETAKCVSRVWVVEVL